MVDGKEYVGSTTDKYLSNRRTKHKDLSKKPKGEGMLVYQAINARPQGWEGIYLDLIEEYPCNSRDALLTRERYWIEQRKPELNVNYKPISTDEERLEVKKRYAKSEKGKKKSQEWKEANPEKLEEYSRSRYAVPDKAYKKKEADKAYYEKNKDKILQQLKDKKDAINITRAKRREVKKDEINEKHRKWYAENKDAINARRRAKKQNSS